MEDIDYLLWVFDNIENEEVRKRVFCQLLLVMEAEEIYARTKNGR